MIFVYVNGFMLLLVGWIGGLLWWADRTVQKGFGRYLFGAIIWSGNYAAAIIYVATRFCK